MRSENGVAAFLDEAADVAAGIRQPMTELVESYPGLRLLDQLHGDPPGPGYNPRALR